MLECLDSICWAKELCNGFCVSIGGAGRKPAEPSFPGQAYFLVVFVIICARGRKADSSTCWVQKAMRRENMEKNFSLRSTYGMASSWQGSQGEICSKMSLGSSDISRIFVMRVNTCRIFLEYLSPHIVLDLMFYVIINKATSLLLYFF